MRDYQFSGANLQGREKRRGVRLNSRVPVTVEWEGATGQAVQHKAHTRVVGPYGCLVTLPEEIQLKQAVRVTNHASNLTNAAVVVWRGQQQSDGWEFGIELIQPEMDFWGLEL
jgi:PilZ domain-containing protein